MRSRTAAALYFAAVAVVLALGVQLFWPTLRLGLFADDYTAAAMLDGSFAAPRGRFDLFNFADGTRADVRALRRLGSVPWWAPDDFRVSFLRPLSSALVHLDRALFGDALWLYHLHSIAAWALLVIAASLLFRRLLPAASAAVATAFFGLDHSHHFAVLWLSNRGGIYASALGVLALLAHLRWRAGGGTRFALASAACLCTGLLLGEWVLPMFAYLIAYEVAGATGPLPTRLAALLPAAVPGFAFLYARAALGYGARGSGAYIDPGAEPLSFLLVLCARIPVFVADMMFNVPASWWDHGSPWRDDILRLELISPSIWLQLPGWPFFHLVLGALGLSMLALAVRWCWPELSRDERTHVRWLLLGALIALVPVAGSFASTRLTMAAFVGVAPVLALVLRQVGRALMRAPAIGLRRWFASYAVGAAVLGLQLVAPLREDIAGRVDDFASTTAWVLAAELDPRKLPEQRVFLLTSSEFTTTFYLAYIWAYHGRPLPRSYAPISTAPYAHDVERVADDALVLRALGGGFLASGQEYMFRSPRQPMLAGQSIALEGARVDVLRTRDGLPQMLQVTFDRSLDDPSLRLLVATRDGLTAFEPPRLHETKRLQRAAHPNWITLQHGREERRLGKPPDLVRFTPQPAFVMYDPTP
jgi:hypothetical protein